MKKILLYLILIMAVGMAGTVAFISVTGLLKVFAGAGTAGLVFFITLEIAKIVATSAIHTYGKIIGWGYNIILSLFILITMAITSLGVYGFLSSTYKESFSKMENMGTQIELLENRRDSYQKQLTSVDTEKESVTQTITELSKGLSNNVIQYKDPETGEIITTTSSSTRRALEKQLDRVTNRQGVLNIKSDELSDKVFEIEGEITDVKLSDGTSTELGPLKYLADVTGLTMDEVMKWFILLLIVVGDPMAVIMVIIFNKVINYGKKDDGHLPKGDDKGDEGISAGPTDDEIIEKAEELKMRRIMDSAVERVSKMDDDDEDEPAAFTKFEEEVEYEVPEQYISAVEDSIIDPSIIEEPVVEVEEQIEENKEEIKKIQREDIKEIKKGTRGYSVDVPQPSNRIDRVGQNKYIKNADGKVIYKRAEDQ